MKRIAPYLVIALVAFMAYGAILWNGAGFSHPDDQAMAELICCQFRPLLVATYTVNHWLGGGWMVVNLLMHLGAAWLLYGITGSVLAACLFSAHPMAADSVASVAGRSSLLTALLVFSIIWLVSKYGSRWILYGSIPLILAIGFRPSLLWSGVPGAPGLLEYTGIFASALVTYILPHLFIPAVLSADPQITYYAGAGSLAIAILVLAVWLFMQYPKLRMGLAFLFLPILPYILIPLPDVFLEHRGYLALAGAAILISMIPRVGVYILACFIALSYVRADVYKSQVALWSDAADKAPGKYRPHNNAAVAHAIQTDYVKAEVEFKKTVELNPDFIPAWDNLAILYVVQGDFINASRTLDRFQGKVK